MGNVVDLDIIGHWTLTFFFHQKILITNLSGKCLINPLSAQIGLNLSAKFCRNRLAAEIEKKWMVIWIQITLRNSLHIF